MKLSRPIAAGLLFCALGSAQVQINVAPASPIVTTLVGVDVPPGLSLHQAQQNNQVGADQVASDAVDVVGWDLPGPATNVTISAYITSGTAVTAYLTTQIGAGTTISNQIATTTLTGNSNTTGQAVAIFTGLNLAAGNYYLTLTSTVASTGINVPFLYAVSSAPGPNITNAAGGVTGLFEGLATGASVAGYPPASTFTSETTNQQTGSPFWNAYLFDVVSVQNSVLPAATVGNPYSASVTATGGVGSYTWSAQLATGGQLSTATGLSIDSSTGIISGTPIGNGTFAITVTATDSQSNHATQGMSLSINISGKVLTANLPAGQAIVNIDGRNDLAHHANASLTWEQPFSNAGQLVEYSVPPGTYTFRVIDPADATALFPNLSGAETSAMWTAWTYNSPWITGWLAFDYSAIANTSETQLFSGADVGPGLANAAAAYADAITNGYENSLYPLIRTAAPQKTWTFANPTTLIFAAPDDDGSDNGGGISVLIAPAAAQTLNVTTESLNNGQVGVAYGPFNMAATGGSGSYSWSATGLPPGLTLSATGVLSGTPAHIGSYNSVVLTVEDTVSGLTAQSSTISVTMAAPSPALSISTAPLAPGVLPAGEVGVVYSAQVNSAGGFGARVFSVSNGAPLSITPAGGVLSSSGALQSSGTLPQFTVTVNDAAGDSVQQIYTVTVNPAVTISTTAIPSPSEGESYAFQLAAANGSPGYTWTVGTGTLPPGFAFSSNGLLSGKSTAPGSFNFTAVVTDSLNATASQGFTVTVTAPFNYEVANRSANLVTVAGDGSAVSVLSATGGGYDVAQDAGGNFYVAAIGSILRVTPSGATTTLATAAGTATWIGITVDPSGNIIAADNTNHQLWRISPDGATQTAFASYIAQPANTAENAKVVVDNAGNYIVAHDNTTPVHIVKVTPAGAVTSLTLSGQPLPNAVGGLALDAAGNYIVLDANQNILFRINPTGGVTILATGVDTGQVLGLVRNPVTGAYVVGDSSNRLESVSSTGVTTALASDPNLSHPEGIVAVPNDYPASVALTQPLGYYRMETNGGLAEDARSSYTLSGGATVGTQGAPIGSPSNNAVVFDGNTGMVTTSQSGGISTAGSIAAWVNLAALPSSRPSFSYIAGESQGGNDFDLQFTQQNQLGFYTTNGGQFISYTPDSTTLVNQWHFIVATFDATASKRAIYWDGALVASDTVTSLTNKTTPFQIGSASPTFSNRNFFGSIDEVGLWNYALSPAQVYRMFITRGPVSAGPITSISPTSAPLNSGATSLTVTGIGFPQGAAVLWTGPNGQTTALTPSSATSTQLNVTVPANLLTAFGDAEVSVTGAAGAPSNQLPFTVTAGPLSISPTSIPNLTVGTQYTQLLTGSGGSGNYSWAITHLDSGVNLTINPNSGTPTAVLSGIPTTAYTDSTTITVQLTDTTTNASVTQNYFPNVNPAPLSISPASIPDLTVGALYTERLTGSGGSGNYSWAITSQASGVNLSITANQGTPTATLSGIPTMEYTDDTRITIRLTDTSTDSSTTQSYFPNVNPAPPVPAGSVPSGTTAWVINEDGSLVAVNGSTGTAVSGGFDSGCEWCIDIARDAAGNFVIAAGDHIARLTPSGTSAGPDIPAPTNPDSPDTTLASYTSVAVDAAGNYIIADNENHQVIRIPATAASGANPTVVYDYSASVGDTEFFEDAYVRIDSAGNYILAEDSPLTLNGNSVLSMFRISPDGSQHAAIPVHAAVNGAQIPVSVGGMTFDAQGNYVVVDWSGSPEGVYTITPTGAATALYTDTNGNLSDAEGIARDPLSGRYFLTDDSNNALFTFNADGGNFSTILSGGVLSPSPGSVVIVNNVPQGVTDYVLQSNATILPVGATGTSVTCDPMICTGSAEDFAADASGNFIIAAGNVLAKVTQTGTTTLIANTPNRSFWVSVAVDATGNYIVVDDEQHQVVKVTPAGVVSPIASYSNLVGDSESEENAIVRIDTSGNYVVAEDNGEFASVLQITPAGAVTNLSLSGSGIPERVGGLTITAAGNYVVVDFESAQVFQITPAGIVSTLVLNPHNFFDTPQGVFYDAATGKILLVDREIEGLFTVSTDGTQVAPIAEEGFNDPITALSLATSPLTITTSALPAGTQGQAYTFGPLTATGGSGSYRWSATGLPSGLAMSVAGVISGTATAASQSTVIVTATDASNSSLTATRTYQLTIGSASAAPPPPPPPPAVSISSSTSSIATKTGGAVSASFTASSGTPPYTFSASGLPAGVTFASNSLSGAPTQAGTFTVIVTVTDSQHVFAQTSVSIYVLGLTTSSLPAGTAGQVYASTVGATGGSAGYSFTASGLPPGISITGDGTLAGTPNTAGSYNATVTVASGGVSVSGSFTIVIAKPLPLSITSNTLPDGTINVPYSQPLTARGGLPPYTWSIISGTLPAGLSMTGSGTVSGTPTTPGAVSFGAQVTDNAGATATVSVTLNIKPAPLTITTQSLPSGMSGVDYPVQLLAAAGGVSPYTWSTGNGNSLPGGVTFASDGSLRGVPSAAGSYSLAAVVTDGAGTKANATLSFTIRTQSADLILTASSLQFSILTPAASTPDAQAVGVQSTVASQTIAYTYSVSPAAPWLSVSGGATTPDTLQVSITSAALSLSAGDYPATITATCTSTTCAGHKQSVSVDLTVNTAPPKLQISTTLLSFASTIATSGPLSQSINLKNAGGGTIGFASVTCEDVWCTAGAPPSTLAGGASATIGVTVDPSLVKPGFYRTLVDIVSSAGRGSVPVTLFLAPSSTMTLAPAGQQFNMPAGSSPGNPNGSFLVSVNNATPANWTASVLPGAPWLVLGTASGTSSTIQPGTVTFSIGQTAAAALAPGAYYGLIRIVSPDLSNSPQDFEVILNVVAATTPLVPDPQPGGLLFITAAGGTLPPQTINVYSGSTSPLTFQTSAATLDGGTWLSVTPATGSAAAGSPGVTTVNVSTNGLKAGVYHGGVSFSLSATAVRTVNVTLIVSAATPSASAVSGSITSRATGCLASKLAPAQTGLVNNFSQPAAWPTPLAIQLSNDCGGLVSNGQVVATFSNGDPPLVLPLVDPSNGLYSGTWSPRKSGSQISINVRASAPGLPDAISQIAGAVTPNLAPSLDPHGELHSFDPLVGGSLAPGTIIQIYGENLASKTAQPSAIPLPNDLNGTEVIIGGVQAPLYYVSAGQVNAQIPFELAPGQQYQVLISANGALTTPDTVQLSNATPGLAVFADGTLIAQHGDGTLVSTTSPATAGEFLVAYGAGLGGTNATPASGAASPSSPLATPTDPPTLTINGTPAPLLFAGLTPGLVGLYQLNFQVPAGLAAGNLTIGVTQDGLASNQAVLPYAP